MHSTRVEGLIQMFIAGATSGKVLDPDSVPKQGAAVENTPIYGC